MINEAADLEIDAVSLTLRQAGDIVPLKPRPFALLLYLVENRDRMVPKSEIIDAVWDGRAVSDGAISTAVRDIRRAICDDAREAPFLRTVYGRGLRWVGPAALTTSTTPERGVAGESIEPSPRPVISNDQPPDDGPRTLAVMLFEQFSDDPAEGRFASFITRDIVTRLSVYRDIRILSPNFSLGARGDPEPSVSRFGAHYCVEGSVRFSSASITVSVQMSEAVSGTQIWAERFAMPIDEAKERVDNTVATIVGSVIPKFTEHEYHRDQYLPDTKLSPTSCFYRGRYLMREMSTTAQDAAITLFERSIAYNPRSGAAHAALASALCNRADLTEDDDDAQSAIRAKARAMAHAALELDPDLAPAWYGLARCLVSANELDEAVHAAETAVRLNEFSVRAQYTLGCALWQIGQAKKALAAFDAALLLCSTDVFRGAVMANRACALVVLGCYDEAIDWSRRAQREPGAPPYAFFGEICGLVHLGRLSDVPDAFDRARQTDASFGADTVGSLISMPNEEVQRQVVDALNQAENIWRTKNAGMQEPAANQEAHSPVMSQDATPRSVVVRPLEKVNLEPALDVIAEMLFEDVQLYLSRSGDILAIFDQPDLQQDASQPSGDTASPTGSAQFSMTMTARSGSDGIVFHLKLFERATARPVWMDRFHLPSAEFDSGLPMMASRITGYLVGSVNVLELKRLSQKPIPALTAWECYVRGRAITYLFDFARLDEAIGLFERAIDLAPGFAEPKAALAYALCVSNNTMSAYENGCEEVDRNTPIRLRAADLAREAVDLAPDISIAWFTLARCHHALGRLENSLVALERGFDLEPNSVLGFLQRGVALWQLDRAEEAIYAYDQALNAGPRDRLRSAVMAGKSIALTLLDRFEEAIEWSRRAQLEPKMHPHAAFGELIALFRLGRVDEAVAFYARAREMTPVFNYILFIHDFPLPNARVRSVTADCLRVVSLAHDGTQNTDHVVPLR